MKFCFCAKIQLEVCFLAVLVFGLAVVLMAALPVQPVQAQPIVVRCLMSGMDSALGKVYWSLTLDEQRSVVVRQISSSGQVDEFKAQFLPTNIFWVDAFGIESSLNRVSGALTKTVGNTTTTDVCRVVKSGA